jgi:hypothetical protein
MKPGLLLKNRWMTSRGISEGVNHVRLVIVVAAAIYLALLCSCTTLRAAPSPLPAEVAFNKEAGTADRLYVTLRLGNGRDVLCEVDTGAPVTVLDKSLEPELGGRVAEDKLGHVYYSMTAGAYRAPNLYLGGVRLLTGDYVWTQDMSRQSSRINPNLRVVGIFGMDCLRHYCIQLDFAAAKMRFLDPKRPRGEDLGTAFPFFMTRHGYVRTRDTLTGATDTSSLIDLGCLCDGVLEPGFLERALQQDKAASIKEWTDPTGWTRRTARLPRATFGGETYTNLFIDEAPAVSKEQTRYLDDVNAIGLSFMARHFVTLDFPKDDVSEAQGPRSIGGEDHTPVSGCRKLVSPLARLYEARHRRCLYRWDEL